MLDPNYYMSEGCGIFAMVLQNLIGGNIVVLSRPNGDKWSNSIPYEVTHIAVLKDNRLYDVKGERSLEEMSTDFGVDRLKVKGPFTKDEFRKRFMGNSDKYPLFKGDKTDAQECLEYIESEKSPLFRL